MEEVRPRDEAAGAEKLGLGLNEAKTRVCDAERESFDFLGYTFGPMVFRRTGKTYVVAAVNRKLQGWRRHKVPERGTRHSATWIAAGELGLVWLQDCRRVSRLHALT